jgi:hypothetical protein
VKPTDFPQKTRVLQKPPSMNDEECQPLAIHDTGEELVSRWEPTTEERQQLAAGAPIWLTIVGRGHPPVRLEVSSPWPGEFTSPRAAPATGPRRPWTARCGACAVTADTTVDADYTDVAAPPGWTSPHGTWLCDRCVPVPASPPPEPAERCACGEVLGDAGWASAPDAPPGHSPKGCAPPEPAEECAEVLTCNDCGHHGRCEREKVRATVPGWREKAGDCDARAPALPQPEESATTVLTGCQMKDTPETRELVEGRRCAIVTEPILGCPKCHRTWEVCEGVADRLATATAALRREERDA